MPAFVVIDILRMAFLTWVRWSLRVVSLCIYLLIKDAENFLNIYFFITFLFIYVHINATVHI